MHEVLGSISSSTHHMEHRTRQSYWEWQWGRRWPEKPSGCGTWQEGLVLNGEREPDMQKPSKGIQELPKKCWGWDRQRAGRKPMFRAPWGEAGGGACLCRRGMVSILITWQDTADKVELWSHTWPDWYCALFCLLWTLGFYFSLEVFHLSGGFRNTDHCYARCFVNSSLKLYSLLN